MNKDIWHKKDEIPSQESRVFWKSGNIVYGGRFDTHYKCFCGPASQFVDLRKVSRWAYIDDFLALEQELIRTRKALEQSEICCTEWEKQALDYKAENIALSSELDRTKKQLEIAVDALKKLEEKAYLTEYAQGVVDKALNEITATEQKDK